MEFVVKEDKDKFELMKKMVEFQKNVKQPKKDKNNPFSKSNYASLQSVQETAVEALEPLGLSFFQDFGINNEGKALSVQTIIISNLGMIKFNPIVLPLEKITAQGVGSASTYARRYALTTNLAIVADEDDDGNNASNVSKNGYNKQNNGYQKRNYQQQPKTTKRNTNQSKPLNESEKLMAEEIRYNYNAKQAIEKIGKQNAQQIFVKAKQIYKIDDIKKCRANDLANLNSYVEAEVKGQITKLGAMTND
ncbi:ERF family protein [Apilactobacillus sp. 1-1-2]|uniref:ERF family protein n=1 Tax=Apilactobacillus sp. 1-1-2 TaxID=3411035 RepID=UPI003B94E0AB